MADDATPLNTAQGLPDALRQAAGDRDEDRFTSLVEAVLHEPDDTAVSLLAPYMDLPGGIGRIAAHCLLMLGAPALEALLARLAGPVPEGRLHAAWALGSLRDPRAADALMSTCEDPAVPAKLCETCLLSLAELADKRQVDPLRSLLRSPAHADHRAAIAFALGHAGDVAAVPDLAPLLADADQAVRLRAAEALVRLLDKRGWPVIFEVLRGEDAQGDSMVAAMRDLGDLTSALTSFVGDEQWSLRREAAEMLGTFGDPQAVPPLIDALRDINPWVRGAAAYALGRLGDRRATRPLAGMLEDASSWVRLCAARGLSLLGDPRAVKALEKVLFDKDPEVASAAQEAITSLNAS